MKTEKPKAIQEDRLLTLEEISKLAGVCRKTVFTWRNRYGLPAIRFGHRTIRILERDWLAWLSKNRVAAENNKNVQK